MRYGDMRLARRVANAFASADRDRDGAELGATEHVCVQDADGMISTFLGRTAAERYARSPLGRSRGATLAGPDRVGALDWSVGASDVQNVIDAAAAAGRARVGSNVVPDSPPATSNGVVADAVDTALKYGAGGIGPMLLPSGLVTDASKAVGDAFNTAAKYGAFGLFGQFAAPPDAPGDPKKCGITNPAACVPDIPIGYKIAGVVVLGVAAFVGIKAVTK